MDAVGCSAISNELPPARMIRLSPRYQRTLNRPVWVTGPGLITSQPIRLCFRPASVDTGIVFVRTDLPGHPRIPAHADHVSDTRRRTTIGIAPVQVTLVEHALAALAGLRIDNCRIELDGVEPPGLDGSAQGFVDALQSVDIELQHLPRTRWTVTAPIQVSAGPAVITLHPASTNQSSLTVHYLLDYGAIRTDTPANGELHGDPGEFRPRTGSVSHVCVGA